MLTFLRLLSIGFQFSIQGLRYLGCRLFYLLFFFLWNRDDRHERIRRLRGQCFTAFLRNLRATFIKLGQIMSARPDLFSAEVIAELETLQDKVPPVSLARARRIIERDLGDNAGEVLARLEPEPIAAASIAQVYEAWLPGGEHVVVKVRRPNIAGIIDRDLRIFRIFARVANVIPGVRNLNLPGLAQQFSTAIRAQLDFRLEVRNNRRFAENFADVSFVSLPDIYARYCGDEVITMSFIEGRKLTEILDDPPIDRAVLAERLLDIYYHMAFKDFLIHADLHPGNLLVDDSGTVHLIDTGLVYEIPEHYIRKFFRVCLAFLMVDGTLIAEAYLEGLDLDDSKRRAASESMEQLAGRYRGASFSEMEMGKIMLEILGLLRRHHIYLDAEWSGMALSDLTFEGMAKMLDTSIDLMALSMRKLPAYVAFHEFLEPDDPVVQAMMRANLPIVAAAG